FKLIIYWALHLKQVDQASLLGLSRQTIITFQHKILPGSVIYSDCWSSYNRIRRLDKDFEHQTVNHDLYFVDPKTGVHTNTIESLWCSAKAHLKTMKGVSRAYLASYLDEYSWRQMNSNCRLDVTDAVLTAISEQYGFEDKDDLVESLENLNTDFSEEDELFEVSDDQEILESFNPNLALYEHEILSPFDKDYANHCDFENEMEVLIKNVYESKVKDFIEIRNLDNTKRHLIHTLADFYVLRHKTFERDTEQCFMIGKPSPKKRGRKPKVTTNQEDLSNEKKNIREI
ncbi:unnamed protein product, partial [Brachionus calyciflorus]